MRSNDEIADADEEALFILFVDYSTGKVSMSMLGEVPVSRVRMKVFKVGGGHDVDCIVRSADVLGFQLHWLGVRSFMCPGSDCPACAEHVGAKWRGLLGVDVLEGSTGGRKCGLIELTDSALGRLRFVADCVGGSGFLGLHIVASRKGIRSPMRIEEATPGAARVAGVREIRSEIVAAAVATLYGLPSPGPGDGLREWEVRAADVARVIIGKAMSRLALNGN